MNQNRLGRGLEAILGESSIAFDAATEEVKEVQVDFLQPGSYQPRMNLDEEALAELAASIRSHGIVQPILVRPIDQSNQYEIIAGERRWRAAQLAGVYEVPVIVREINDSAVLAISLIENIQRQDLNPVEEATALKRLNEELSLTHEEIAQSVGKSRATISNLLRLLSLTDKVLEHLNHGRIEVGHAKVLLGLQGDSQVFAAAQVIKKQLSVRQTESLVKQILNQANNGSNQRDKTIDTDIVNLQRDLSERLGAPVTIHDNGGKGTLRIRYHSLDALDGIIDKIN